MSKFLICHNCFLPTKLLLIWMTEGTVDQDDNGPIRFENGKKVGKRWKVLDKLDEGGFGQVYKVEDLKNPGKLAALKVENVDMEGGSAIKLEMNVLEHLRKKGQSPHLPAVYHAKKHKKYVYMVLELLGRNLKYVKGKYDNDLIPVADWSRLGIQCLHAIKIMHDRGFVHRDIKPSNFVLGHSTEPLKTRLVHVLDFGLARAYAFKKGSRWESRKARMRIDFRGTYRYASPNMHRSEDLGRRDDLYSLVFMLIEFHCGLPWQADREKENIEVRKLYMEDHPEMMNGKFPSELCAVLPHLKTLNFYSRPNYSLFYDGLKELIRKSNVSMTDRYEWESEGDYKKFKSALRENKKKNVCICEDMDKTMAADPIKIVGPPSQFNSDNDGPTKEDFNQIQQQKSDQKGTTTDSKRDTTGGAPKKSKKDKTEKTENTKEN